MCRTTTLLVSPSTAERRSRSLLKGDIAVEPVDARDDENKDYARSPPVAAAAVVAAENDLRRAVLYGSLSMFFLVGGLSVVMPYSQSRRDELGCDALCQGSLTSLRSLLRIVGGTVLGRLSDGGGVRRRVLFVYTGCVGSVVDLLILGSTNSVRGLWWSTVTGGLTQQNFSFLKAIVAEHHDAVDDARGGDEPTPAAGRAGSVGRLGMSVGLAFMVGPLLGGRFVDGFDRAVTVGVVLVSCAVLLASRIPSAGDDDAAAGARKKSDEDVATPTIAGGEKEKKSFAFPSFLRLEALRSPAAVFFVVVRVCMALSFHVFNTVWAPSLKRRFDFGPKDYGQYFSFIGVTFALSQGLVAGRLVRFFGPERRVALLALCCAALGAGRWIAFHTDDLTTVYIVFSFVISALGVLNTVIATDTSRIAGRDEIGGFLGTLDAVESVAGMVGPVLGGLLGRARLHDDDDGTTAPLAAVVGLYAFVLLLVVFKYDACVVKEMERRQRRTSKTAADDDEMYRKKTA